jgi:hypothetical protein
VFLQTGIQGGWDDQGSGGNRHQGRHGGCDGRVEGLFLEPDATCNKAASKDKEYVGQNASKHAGLDNPDLVVSERNDADLHGVSLDNLD